MLWFDWKSYTFFVSFSFCLYKLLVLHFSHFSFRLQSSIHQLNPFLGISLRMIKDVSIWRKKWRGISYAKQKKEFVKSYLIQLYYLYKKNQNFKKNKIRPIPLKSKLNQKAISFSYNKDCSSNIKQKNK